MVIPLLFIHVGNVKVHPIHYLGHVVQLNFVVANLLHQIATLGGEAGTIVSQLRWGQKQWGWGRRRRQVHSHSLPVRLHVLFLFLLHFLDPRLKVLVLVTFGLRLDLLQDSFLHNNVGDLLVVEVL